MNLPYSNYQEMALGREGVHFVFCPSGSPIPKNWSSVSPLRGPILIPKWRICPNLLELRLSFVVTSYIVRDFYHTTTSTATKTTLNKDNSHSSNSIAIFQCCSLCQNAVGAAKKYPSCDQVDLPIVTGVLLYNS